MACAGRVLGSETRQVRLRDEREELRRVRGVAERLESLLHPSVTSAMIGHSMAVRHADVHPGTGPQVGRNWALIGLVGLCVEFWIVAVAILTAYL